MTIFDENIIAQWEHHTHTMTFDEGIQWHSTRIWLFYFDDKIFPLHSSVGFSLQATLYISQFSIQIKVIKQSEVEIPI